MKNPHGNEVLLRRLVLSLVLERLRSYNDGDKYQQDLDVLEEILQDEQILAQEEDNQSEE